jgi:hypothetical protein
MDEIDITVTLTEKELAFRERAREAGLPAIVVSMYAGALQRLVDKERPWVGLTDDEIKEIIGPWGDTPIKGYTRKLFDQIEAKLREKNEIRNP